MFLIKYAPYIVFIIVWIIALYFNYIVYWSGSFVSDIRSVGSATIIWWYIFLLSIIFWLYKCVQYILWIKKYEITPLFLLWVFFFHLLILCMYFFGISGNEFLLGVTFWIFLSIRLIAILLLWVMIYLVGKRFLELIGVWKLLHHEAIKTIISLVIGFFLLILALFFIASIGLYNIYWLIFTIWCILFFIFPTWITFFKNIRSSLWTVHLKTESWYVKSFIDELNYIVLTLFIGVNLISAYRPYPIGWDDLWAYMNYPKLLSSSEWLIDMWYVYAWELYTWIGYILWSQSFAFLLNSFSWVIAALILYLGFTLYQKKDTSQNWSFSYPLLATLILIILPMTVFQLAKDMKLDYGLLFVSMGAFFLSYYMLYKNIDLKNNWKLWIIVWVCIWFAFSIKVTSLLLLLGIISFLAYTKGWIYLYLASFFGMLTFFSYAWLWGMLNVVFPDDSQTRLYYSMGSFLLTIIFLVLSYKKEIKAVDFWLYFKQVGLIIVWCIIAFFPWGVKHMHEIHNSWASYRISTLISGVPDRFRFDYSLIHDAEELQERRSTRTERMSDDGTTTNEDLGRYFWYESGINNYLKLPWNLTFQVNQWGEFTSITYIFFILLPIFLFVFIYKGIYVVPLLLWLWWVSIIYFIPSSLSDSITHALWFLRLPFWYIFIIVFYFSLILILHFFIKKQQHDYSKQFLWVLAFGSLYVFFWAISSFGIVWYGIVMYAIFLSLIVIWLHQSDTAWYKYVPYCALFWVWIYIMLSGLTHAIHNLQTARYIDFKLWGLTEYESLMKHHPEYFLFIYAFNLNTQWQEQVLSDTKQGLLDIFSQDEEYTDLLPIIAKVNTYEELNNLIHTLNVFTYPSHIERQYDALKQDVYSLIINPPHDIRSEANVYRLGTFMNYFIVDNYRRVVSDNRSENFDRYIWDEDPSITTQRLQKLGITYMLVDLNAATIDHDPRQDLTRRYENLLAYTMSQDVEFMAGDSTCYRIARDRYNAWEISLHEAIYMAWVNYGSAKERTDKTRECIVSVYDAIRDGVYQDTPKFNYLLVYKNRLERIIAHLREQNIEITEQEVLTQFARFFSHGHKILLRIP